jgi:hypothetical protein
MAKEKKLSFPERLDTEAKAQGYMSWEYFERYAPERAEIVRQQVMKKEKEVGLW